MPRRCKVITISQLANFTGFHVRTLRRLAAAGKIPGARQIKPGGHWRINLDKLMAEAGHILRESYLDGDVFAVE